MMRGLERAGALAVEVGVPFSDPIADGPEIQRSSEWALRQGVGPAESLELVRRFRVEGKLPVVLMTYANPVLRLGVPEFAGRARAAGVDGVLITDLPPDEAPETWSALDREGLDTILLVAPTTAPERVPRLVERCRGFVYCVARTGVTGRGEGYAGSIGERVAELRRHTPLPIAIGFGISTPDKVRELKGVADALVVGAAFMRAVSEDPARGAVERVIDLAGRMREALK